LKGIAVTDRAFSRVIALAASMSICALVSGQIPVSADDKMKCWTINANSEFMGSLVSQFDKSAMRMTLDKLGLTVVSTAPKWDGIAYSEQNKKYVSFPFSKWKQKFRMGFSPKKSGLGEGKLETVRTGKTATIQGQMADEYLVKIQTDKVSPDQKGKSGKKSGHTLTVQNIGPDYIDLWVASKIQPPSQFSFLLKNMMGVPSDKGMPLKVTRHSANGKPLLVLDATKVTEVSAPKSDFELPKGMKQVEDEMGLFISDDEDTDTDLSKDSKVKGASKGTAEKDDHPVEWKPSAGSVKPPPPRQKQWWEIF
jgi:hypothetical protein